MVSNHEFDRELYEFVAEFTVPICALSERAEDVPELFEFFM